MRLISAGLDRGDISARPPIRRVLAFLLSAGFLLGITFRAAAQSPAPASSAAKPKDVSPPASAATTPLEARTKLVKGIAGETVFESIDNLPNFDDTVWVLGDMGNDALSDDGYQYQRRFIPKLNRVRKILAQSKENRTEVVSRLKKKLSESAPGFEKIDREKIRLVVTGGGALSEPDEHYRRLVYAPAATYLLEELNAFDALPVMRDVYTTKEKLPVSRIYLYYAMHLLVTRHPTDGLSAKAKKARDEYLAAAKDLAPPSEGPVLAWNAAFDEGDFRLRMKDVLPKRAQISLDREPTIRLAIYPDALDKWEDWRGTPDEKTDRLFQKLRPFVDLAYP